MTIGHDEIRRLVPHGGSMCLLDTVESWDQVAIVCRTMQHRDRTNPLRSNDRLSSVHAIEFAAQAVAAHGALVAAAGAMRRIGLLASVRNCRFHCATLDDVDGALRVEARAIGDSGELVIYEFAVRSDAHALVEGRISIFKGQPSNS